MITALTLAAGVLIGVALTVSAIYGVLWYGARVETDPRRAARRRPSKVT